MNRITLASRREGVRPPLADWEREILAYVVQHPTDEVATSSYPASLIYSYILGWGDLDHSEEKALVEAMKLSPNRSIRQLAAGREQIAQLREHPWSLRFTALDGQPVDMAKLKGKVVLLDGWSIWCSSCVEALPKIKSLREKYRDQGLEVIGICFVPKSERDEAKSLKVIKEKEVNWPIGMLKDAAAKEFWARYGIFAMPVTWLFDREGRLINSRYLHDEMMEQEIRKALGLPPLSAETPNKVTR